MVAPTLAADDRAEALIREPARLFAQALVRVTRPAPDGQVLARAEQVVLAEGRAFLRRALPAPLEAASPPLEEKGPRPAWAPAAGAGT